LKEQQKYEENKKKYVRELKENLLVASYNKGTGVPNN
jgi:hypothetical protein